MNSSTGCILKVLLFSDEELLCNKPLAPHHLPLYNLQMFIRHRFNIFLTKTDVLKLLTSTESNCYLTTLFTLQPTFMLDYILNFILFIFCKAFFFPHSHCETSVQSETDDKVPGSRRDPPTF